MALAFAEIAFTQDVLAQQERMGSGGYKRFLSNERMGGDILGPQEAEFIAAADGFYQASVSETGWPYVQFRGGAAGFLQVLGARTLAYADLRGNRQYVSLGNLSGNDRVSLIIMDYLHARRLKIWGRVQMIEKGSTAWDAHVFDAPPASNVERIVAIHVEAFDWNCPQHIPRRFTKEEAVREIQNLEQENADLRAKLLDLQAQDV